jgi:glycosyltransferase involved in cell wall biosynthesis
MALYGGSMPYDDIAFFDIHRRGRADLGFLFRMVRAMRSWRPDIVHTHVHNGKYWGRIAAIVAGVPAIVHTEHDSNLTASAPERAVNRLLHRSTDAVIAFTPVHAQLLTSYERVPPEKLCIIMDGIDVAPTDAWDALAARDELGVPAGSKLIVHVGRFEPVKNQRLALAAFARLRSETPGLRAVMCFVGDGAGLQSVREAAAPLGESVRFAGYRTDARRFIAAADAILITSRNESLSLVLLEALAEGVPVVSVPWSGVEQLLVNRQLGTIAADFRAESLARALREVLQASKESTEDRARNARLFARGHYDIRAVAAQHEHLYRSLRGAHV